MTMNSEKKELFCKLLAETKREGIENLISCLESNGFFDSPCSTKYHLCTEGGLLEHSLNVYDVLCQLNESMNAGIPVESIVLCALLHDIGKAGDHGKKNYVPKYVRSKSKNKETGEYDMVRSVAEPFESNKDLMYEEHEIRSVIIAERFIYLSEDEETAILHHNGLFGKLDTKFGTGDPNFCKTKLAFLLHTADMYCSRFLEVDPVE